MSRQQPFDWQKVEARYRDDPLQFASVGSIFGSNEAGVAQVFHEVVVDPSFCKGMGWPPLGHLEREMSLPRGRPDFILFHIDGSATIVEIKNRVADRDLFTGIGQLHAYGVQLGLARAKVREIRLALAAPIPVEESIYQMYVCMKAGVEFIPLNYVEVHELLALTDLERQRRRRA